MKGVKIIKSFLFLGILALLSLPIMQSQLEVVEVPKLNGSYSEALKSDFSVNNWFSRVYQDEMDTYLNEHFGFRNFLVRLYNQIDYSLFAKGNAGNVVVGREGFLYEEGYIKAAMGTDFLGETNLKISVKKLSAIRDTLESLDKELIMVLAPSKGSYYPQYYPVNWKDSTKSISNYEVFSHLLREQEFNLLDVNDWFRKGRDTSKTPLFSKTGTHWTKYGEYLVMDSMMKYVGNVLGEQLPNLVLDSVLTESVLYNTDDDIEKSLNLIFDIPDYDNLIYPSFHFAGDSNTVRPKVLTIADSFYWGLHNSGMTNHTYIDGDFWYYFRDVYPARYGAATKVAELNLTKELADFDAVILLCTEINIYCFHFIEKAYEAYYSGAKSELSVERINYFVRKIKSDETWYAKVVKQAEEKGITIEQSLQENAEYMVFQESVE